MKRKNAMPKENINQFWKMTKLVVIWIVILEVLGCIGFFALRPFVRRTPYDATLSKMLPHPLLRGFEEMQSGFLHYDPNLGWYDKTRRFGEVRRELLPKRSGEYRVFILGGSTVDGTGARNKSESIAKRLEHYLNQSSSFNGKKVIVYNEGISGYYSKQELLLLATKILPFQEPDMIVVLDGVNDFIDHTVSKISLDRIYSGSWHYRELQHTKAMDEITSPRGACLNAANWMVAFIVKKTYLGNFLDFGYRILTDRANGLLDHFLVLNPRLEPSNEVPEYIVDYYLDNIFMMKSLCDGQNVKFYWFPQPTLFLKESLTNSEDESFKKYSEDFWNNFRKFYEEMSKKAGVRFSKSEFFHDLSTSLSTLEHTAYIDVCHYTPVAQDAIAKLMSEYIRSVEYDNVGLLE
ncbi:SGNH/GDSL hydrolase family protein [Candidatus Omnitrophota bacterium]